MTKNKFLFLILAGALVFATLGCKQVTNSGSGEQGGGDKPSVEPTPDPVPDTWTEITDITGYEGTYSCKLDVVSSGQPVSSVWTVVYPVVDGDDPDCVKLENVYDYTAIVESMESGADDFWTNAAKSKIFGDGTYSSGKPYTVTDSDVYSKAAFIALFTREDEFESASMFINQSKTKVKVVEEYILTADVAKKAAEDSISEAEAWKAIKEELVSDAMVYSENPYKRTQTLILVKK